MPPRQKSPSDNQLQVISADPLDSYIHRTKLAGRPTGYKDEYNQMLSDHMAGGLSFESFGGVVDVARDTLYQWLERHEGFSDAHKIGRQKQIRFWESVGRDGVMGKIKGFNVVGWLFNMKCRFRDNWREDSQGATTVNNFIQFQTNVTDRGTVEVIDSTPVKPALKSDDAIDVESKDSNDNK